MTTNYQILTDSSCDLPASLARTLGVSYAPLRVQFQGAEYENFLDGDPRSRLEMKAFYKTLRTGAPTSTTAVNPEGWSTLMAPILAAGQDLLILAFSSGLSSTYAAAVLAAQELAPQYPGRTIRVVDTLCASLGQGLLVWYAVQEKNKGGSIEAVRDWAEAHKLNLCHWFTVDDLHFLKRGGRVSAATAVVGSMLQIKPVLHVDNEGHLINMGKARGRHASLTALVDHMEQTAIDPGAQTVFISHGDCLEEAERVADDVRKRFGVKEIIINNVGPVIGAHSGPGTMALFFMGRER